MSKLSIHQDQPDPKLSILHLSGEFEGYAALDAKEQLIGLLSEIKTPTVLIDMAGIRYIDSAALGILLELSKLAEGRKLSFGLLNVHDPVKKVILVTQLDKVIKIWDK